MISLSWKVCYFFSPHLLLHYFNHRKIYTHKQHSWHFLQNTRWCKIESAQSDKHLLAKTELSTEKMDESGKFYEHDSWCCVYLCLLCFMIMIEGCKMLIFSHFKLAQFLGCYTYILWSNLVIGMSLNVNISNTIQDVYGLLLFTLSLSHRRILGCFCWK